MIGHYLTYLYRISRRNRLHTAIHIIGLSIGLAASMFLLLFVMHELSYDQQWENGERIFVMQTKTVVPGREPMHWMTIPGPFKDAIVKEYPQVEKAGRVFSDTMVISSQAGGKEISYEEELTLVDPEFLDIFALPVVSGDLATRRGDPRALIVSTSFAEKYFGKLNVVGETMKMRQGANDRAYTVVAVIEDPPETTHMTWEAISYLDARDFADRPWMLDQWFSMNALLYLQLQTPAQASELEPTFSAFADRVMPVLPMGRGDRKPSDVFSFHLCNLRDIHLRTEALGGMKPRGDIDRVYVLAAVALLILAIASINFVNLSTARATRRAREVSLRKVLGAPRKQLMWQITFESLTLSFFALIFAFSIVELGMHRFGELMNRSLDAGLLHHPEYSLLGLALATSVGLLGGLYPAWVISGFRPAAVLKSSYSAESTKQGYFRIVLVIVQFAISSCLIVCTGVLWAQTNAATNVDLGFDRAGLLAVRGVGEDETRGRGDSFVKSLAAKPGVLGVTRSGSVPMEQGDNNSILRLDGTAPEDAVLIGRRNVAADFFEVLGGRFIAGRSFDRQRSTEVMPDDAAYESDQEVLQAATVINVSATRLLGFGEPQDAVGRRLIMTRTEGLEGDTTRRIEFEIIGVVEDLRFTTIHRELRPEFFTRSDGQLDRVLLRVEPSLVESALAQIEELWRAHVGAAPFDASFVDNRIKEAYDQEAKLSRLFLVAALIAVCVACLGLFGLSAFIAERRTKEIGIRKVMGASVAQITRLLLTQFTGPVFLANLVGCPLGLYLMSDWLAQFTVRIDLWTTGAWIAGATMAVNLAVAWLTISYHAIRVARASPIAALRYE